MFCNNTQLRERGERKMAITRRRAVAIAKIEKATPPSQKKFSEQRKNLDHSTRTQYWRTRNRGEQRMFGALSISLSSSCPQRLHRTGKKNPP